MCHLLYLLYSLKQAALDWYELLSSVLQILTSMDHQHLLSHDGETFPDVKNLEHVYHNIIGYFSTSSQPNIAFAVQCLTQPCAQPEAHHFAAAKWVVCYLWGMQTLHIHLGNPKVILSFHAFSNFNSAADPSDCISVTCYVWFFYGGSIVHTSKKQVTHTLSTTKAKHMALSACVQEELWLKSFLWSLHHLMSLLLYIHADNTVAISLAMTPSNCFQTCYIIHVFLHKSMLLEKSLNCARLPPIGMTNTLIKSLNCCTFTDH